MKILFPGCWRHLDEVEVEDLLVVWPSLVPVIPGPLVPLGRREELPLG